MFSQPSAGLYALAIGALAAIAGQMACRAYVGRSRRMMNSLTVFAHGGRTATRSRPWYATLGWTLMLGGLTLCAIGIWTACAAP
jgi:hypothetical protein